jgi:hypothetical protein
MEIEITQCNFGVILLPAKHEMTYLLSGEYLKDIQPEGLATDETP